MSEKQQAFVFDGTTEYMRLPDSKGSIDARFARWRQNHPQDLKDFEDECLALLEAGAKYISARDVCGDIRRRRVKEQGEEFRVNNDFARCLADWVCRKHPKLKPLFEQRERPSQRR